MTQQINIDKSIGIMIERLAKMIIKRVPDYSIIEYNDLYQTGIMAVLEALPRYDPSRGASKTTYLSIRARGAMLDELRKVDPLSKGHRRRIREGLEEDVVSMSINQVRGNHIVNNDSNDDFEFDFWSDATCDTVFDEVLEMELKELCTQHLSDNRQITQLRMKGVLTQLQIGKMLGMSESRVSQIFNATTKHVRGIVANGI